MRWVTATASASAMATSRAHPWRIQSESILVRADGHGVPELLDAILQLIPLDEYVETPAMIMQVTEQDKGMEVPIIDEYKKIVEKYDKRGAKTFGEYERFEFYEQAKKCYCILQSGETAIYANIILQKGVVNNRC